MTRSEITVGLSNLLEKHIDPNRDQRIYWANEVTFDYGTDHAVRVDYMQFKPVNNSVSGIEKGDFYCYEIKSSVEDFKSKNGHNFIGDYNYYVMPEDVFLAIKFAVDIPFYVGVFVPVDDGSGLKSAKRARRHNREKSALEMLMMMFRSAARDRR